MSGGWSPAVHLHSQSGAKNRWDEASQCFVPGEAVQNSTTAGAGAGKFGLQDCLEAGAKAAEQALAACGIDPAQIDAPAATTAEEYPIQALWRVPGRKGSGSLC